MTTYSNARRVDLSLAPVLSASGITVSRGPGLRFLSVGVSGAVVDPNTGGGGGGASGYPMLPVGGRVLVLVDGKVKAIKP